MIFLEKLLQYQKKAIFAEKYNIMIILSVKQFSNRLKATVQSSGRLNFTEETTKILGLTEDTLIKFALEDESNDTLYLVISSVNDDEDAFRVRKSGSYLYVPTKSLFDALGIEYDGKSLVYDLIRATAKDAELGGMVFKMSPRDKNKNGGEEDVND